MSFEYDISADVNKCIFSGLNCNNPLYELTLKKRNIDLTLRLKKMSHKIRFRRISSNLLTSEQIVFLAYEVTVYRCYVIFAKANVHFNHWMVLSVVWSLCQSQLNRLKSASFENTDKSLNFMRYSIKLRLI